MDNINSNVAKNANPAKSISADLANADSISAGLANMDLASADLAKSPKIPQLLSPAGNLHKLKVALAYGADAVYGSPSQFSLRSRAGQAFVLKDFAQGIDYAHKRGKKVFVTINGFPFNSQLESLKSHICKMAELKPDAFIVAAPGIVRLCKSLAPQVPIHLSTQANVLNVLDAQVFYDMGVKRIVAARELSLKDALIIKREIPNLELEIFIHGSMCFAFSGRCLISALQNGRMPNRGSCANDCRFDYKYFVRSKKSGELVEFDEREFYAKNPDNGVLLRLQEEEGFGTHIFNSKDLNLASHIKEIIDSDCISALKIEGRTKSTYYAGITARTYKMALNDYARGVFNAQNYQDELRTLKNRGFTDGFLVRKPFERLDTQNYFTAISEGSYQVNAEVSECGELAMCRHTIRAGEAKEIVAPLDCDLREQKGAFGEIYKVSENDKNGGGKKERFFMRFEKIVLENGKELDSIHSGNTNAIQLPVPLPPFSFLREQIL